MQESILVKQSSLDWLVNNLVKLENSQGLLHKDSYHHAMGLHQLKWKKSQNHQ